QVDGQVRRKALSHDGRQLALGLRDQTIRLWDVDAGLERARLRGHGNRIQDIEFSPDGQLLVSVTALDFGTTDCGGTAAAKTLVISNTGSHVFTWAATLGLGASSPYGLTPASGALDPGQNVTVTVTPGALPATSSIAVGAFDDSLTITPAGIDGGKAVTVPLRQSARGAIIVFNALTSYAFGDVAVGTQMEGDVTLVNNGNAAVSLTLAATPEPPFSLANTTPLTLNPTDTAPRTLRFNPTTVGDFTGNLTLAVQGSGPICAPLPQLPLSGSGIDGQIGLSVASLDFGLTDCGTRAAAQTVVVSNTGKKAFYFQAYITGTSAAPYALDITQGTIQPGANATLTVTPPTIPAQSATTPTIYSDTLTIQTDIVGDVNHTVGIAQTARGAILTSATNAVAFPEVFAGDSSSAQFTLLNSGNVAASPTLSALNPVFSFSPVTPALQPAGAALITGTFAPTVAGPYSDNLILTLPAGTALCAPLPEVTLQGLATPAS
ncbi:MAG: choice-of-anchor D domain-containing protein, partial [Armatimonadetes bacterium]|nr:choice-of-anchor D domain-containing protein [Armatimonadota bacterium]